MRMTAISITSQGHPPRQRVRKRPKQKSKNCCHGGGQGQRQSTTSDFLAEFFAKYPPFKYDPSSPVTSEFHRMCNLFGWDMKDKKRTPEDKKRTQEDKKRTPEDKKRMQENKKMMEARQLFRDSIVKQFNSIYGSDGEDVRSWQNLCDIIQIKPIPDGLLGCRKAVQRAHINICELVDFQKTQKNPKKFNSELELSQYTNETEKYFPKHNAYAGGLLRYLLRHILNPSKDRGANSRTRSHGRNKRR